ncbi:MAG: Stk1 family PASTA domain-containing Ser/Thr kinase [Mobilibacterium timonense]|uniref:Stk1 family PASTA domain-containing Ser/Thr kinase n=2 Tax=Mobilibacterium timonense TaxID=1871012 RepID=UPI0009864FAA|nr:Stk1 family PASTA domain-containing Ser/Thr kinase [Mobilibacterium timonense]MBM6990902.1 Stk1 family PASTA domain-containing Ser/Thr kinase [Mobilibacterium timonense]
MSSRLLAGRYELIQKIGDGGMAVVYKAKDKLLNRYIAIKILRPEFTKDEVFVENFKRESQAAAKLSHPNIVGVYDVGKEGNINYIVMELVDGRPLSDIIAEEAPMDYRTVINIARQVASALSVAHKNKIIHRDVKPHNILMTKDGVAKLADFGIAKAVNDATLSTGSKVIGSIHYFSPEQARGNYVDERSDIYSLGIVMYEMITGRVPFDGDNPVTVALKHINEDVIPPSEFVSGIPPALERCIMKCTDKFQTNRYSSADELIEELDNIEFVTKMVGESALNKAMETKDQEEEEEDSGKKKKKKKKRHLTPEQKKKRRIIAIVAAICLIPLLVLGVKALTTAKTTVPDLSNMTYAEAKAAAEDAGFKIEKGSSVYSDSVTKNHVADQDPGAGTEAKRGRTITVNLSKGSKDGTVPNVVGMNYDEVEKYLKKYGYKLGVVKEQTSTQAAGTILSQDPEGGADASKGSRVNIVISDGKGKEKATVPSVTGMSLAQAKAAIANAGFTVGNITYDESNVYGNGYVMWQQYAANTQLDKGTTIDIEVSKGKPQTDNGGDSGDTGDSTTTG